MNPGLHTYTNKHSTTQLQPGSQKPLFDCLSNVLNSLDKNRKYTWGQRGGPVGKYTCHQVCPMEFNAQNPHGRENWVDGTMCAHRGTQSINANLHYFSPQTRPFSTFFSSQSSIQITLLPQLELGNQLSKSCPFSSVPS